MLHPWGMFGVVDDGWSIDLADSLEHADGEVIDCDQLAGVVDLDRAMVAPGVWE